MIWNVDIIGMHRGRVKIVEHPVRSDKCRLVTVKRLDQLIDHIVWYRCAGENDERRRIGPLGLGDPREVRTGLNLGNPCARRNSLDLGLCMNYPLLISF